MSDTPKFEVIDRRKIKAEEEKEGGEAAAHPAQPEKTPDSASSKPAPGPRLVVNEPKPETEGQAQGKSREDGLAEELPPPPTAEETNKSKAAYDASAQRLEDLIRAQDPSVGAQPPVGFDHLVQQLYLTAMLQMGAGTQDGQAPRVDIVGARATIDLLGVLAEKTKGNLTAAEDVMLQSVLFEARLAFLEITSMMTMPKVPPTPESKK